jgi:hypothetical protein
MVVHRSSHVPVQPATGTEPGDIAVWAGHKIGSRCYRIAVGVQVDDVIVAVEGCPGLRRSTPAFRIELRIGVSGDRSSPQPPIDGAYDKRGVYRITRCVYLTRCIATLERRELCGGQRLRHRGWVVQPCEALQGPIAIEGELDG